MGEQTHSAPGWNFGMPRWVPNAISTLRVVLVPVWLGLAFQLRSLALAGQPVDRVPLLVVLLLLGASDILDGQIARRFHLTSNLGATLDAVADKLAQVATVTFLAWFAVPVCTPLPLWLWSALLLRDLLLAIGWVVVWRRHRTVRVVHRWHGKAASTLLFVLVLAATAGAPLLPIQLGAIAIALFTAIGTAAYLQEGWRQL